MVLTAEQCATLAGVLGDGVRRRRARGDVVGVEVLAIVDEVTAVARGWRAASALGNAVVPRHDVPDDEDHDGLNTKQAAERLGVSDRRVRQMIDTGRLSGRKHGGAWYVPASAVEQLARTREAPA